MPKQYSIAEARHNLAGIVHELERVPLVELTRRGKAVAVLLSMRELSRLQSKGKNFWDSYSSFLSEHELQELKIEPDTFAGLRDRSPGRQLDK